MDLIYTDKNRIEQGVLHNYEVDFDTTGKKDFQITTGIQNNVIQGGFWWYIEGTEYGGRIDAYNVITETNEIKYTGRNFRGLLNSKIIEPPQGHDHKIMSGTLQGVVSKIIKDVGLQDVFVVDECNEIVVLFKFYRYIKTYAGIYGLAEEYGLKPYFLVQDGMVHIGFEKPIDYSDDNEYTQDDLNFSIKRSFDDVNHLICLGQGELSEREVIHLYVDNDGNVSETQSIFGSDEITDIYENTNAEDIETLKNEGIKRLNELKNNDSFEVTVPDMELKIGDIIGGVERVTGTYVASDIVNIIAKLSDSNIDLEYKVGDDSTNSNIEGNGACFPVGSGYGIEVDENGDLYIYHEEGATIPTAELDNEGNLYLTSDEIYEYTSASGDLWKIRE